MRDAAFSVACAFVILQFMAHPAPQYVQRGKVPINPAPRKPRILLAACGSVAAIKFAKICECFSDRAEVKAVATLASLRFIDIASLPKNVDLYTDKHEWSYWGKVGDNALHIELHRWADLMVIAPLSANTLAKYLQLQIAGGICDNLLTCIVRAWDYSKPMFIAPGMNTLMWRNPFTKRHLMSVDELGVSLIPGNEAMAEPSQIYSTVILFLESRPLPLD
ncbi:hypothetical protein V6N11_025970 [Hibiscus sabdariffa]|uniref:phosphopantothenoylcysteine decarboxylase n=1 Tax=Hibiscus sabdariffa TaxID=183260 RepID=A0ABR2SUJ4_9ROSI